MFIKKSLTLAFTVFTCAAFAFNHLAFFQGLNQALDLQDNKIINQCIRHLTMNEKSKGYKNDFSCYEAVEVYTEAFFVLAHADSQGQTSEETTLRALDSTITAFENLENENNYKAGQGVAEIAQHLASIFGSILNERLSSTNGISFNSTAILFGLNDQLQLSGDESLTDCLVDSTQMSTLIRALSVALKHKELSHSFQDIVTIIKYFPGFKSTCATVLQGFANFVNPIEQAAKSNPKAFWKLIRTNIIKNPFVVAGNAINVVQNLEKGDDYEAGLGLGKFLQFLFQGIN